MYLTIKSLHIVLIMLSFLIFAGRGVLMLMKNSLYRQRIFRYISPIVDTLLLGSGITLMILAQQYPTSQSWLAVKLTALIFYIVFGVMALNRINNYKVQVISFIAAVSTFLLMVSIARTHHPLGLFSIILN